MKRNFYKQYSTRIITCAACLGLMLSFAGCKKAADVGAPVTQLASENIYTSNATAQSAVAGIYSTMANINGLYNGAQSIGMLQGLAADELVTYTNTGIPLQFYGNALSSQNQYYWTEMYKEIFYCNTAIAGLSHAPQLTPSVQQQLLGEVKFIRAFVYFYAVNLYGSVPLITTTDFKANSTISRAPIADVYVQIVKDLKEAQGLLPDNKYLNGTNATSTDRVRPNKQAASALLARAYLYQKDWANAEAQATSVIGASSYTLESNLNNVFLKASKEAILQLMPVQPNYNNADAVVLVVTARPTTVTSALPLSNFVVNAFEANDNRFNSWVGKYNAAASGSLPAATYYYANKYKNNSTLSGNTISEYPILLRLAETYLIRAEARAQQNNVSGAQADLNAIRTRAGLPNTTANTQVDLVAAVLRERQVELFTEWGHRWFDLKRTGTLDARMATVAPTKSTTWDTNKQLVPIPASEILLDPNLVQNPGY